MNEKHGVNHMIRCEHARTCHRMIQHNCSGWGVGGESRYRCGWAEAGSSARVGWVVGVGVGVGAGVGTGVGRLVVVESVRAWVQESVPAWAD